jgi:hypothetical protein
MAPPQEKLRPEEVRREFIRNSPPLARVVALYIRVEAKKPVSINRWTSKGTGRATGATGYLAEKGVVGRSFSDQGKG